jgi:hypothetical protein
MLSALVALAGVSIVNRLLRGILEEEILASLELVALTMEDDLILSKVVGVKYRFSDVEVDPRSPISLFTVVFEKDKAELRCRVSESSGSAVRAAEGVFSANIVSGVG